MRPALPIANKERASPNSENIITTVKSSLDFLATDTLAYIISSTSSEESELLASLRED